ncbi:MAG: hypothetical protein AB7U82_12510 [Blastocatellales bacterium]
MRFDYTAFQRHTSRGAKPALLALTISLFAFFALLSSGYASQQRDRFSIDEATTVENNGKRIKAKSGFQLVRKGNDIVARKTGKNVESYDRRRCTCDPTPQGGASCQVGTPEGTLEAECGAGNSSACCKWIPVK